MDKDKELLNNEASENSEQDNKLEEFILSEEMYLDERYFK